jgi:hypothetical protein
LLTSGSWFSYATSERRFGGPLEPAAAVIGANILAMSQRRMKRGVSSTFTRID